MANILETFQVKSFDGADSTWTMPTKLSSAQLALQAQNYFALTSMSSEEPDICFIKNKLKEAFEVQHEEAKLIPKWCCTNLMVKLRKSGLLIDDGEPTSRMKLMEAESTKDYIDSDVKYEHVQNLLGVDTTKSFEWNPKRSVELFATVRRVFFGTLRAVDGEDCPDYFAHMYIGEFGNPPEKICKTDENPMIKGQCTDWAYLESKHQHAYHAWRMDFIQRVDHLLSFVLTDRLRTGYFNWHQQQYEKAEAARIEKEKAEEEAKRVAAEEARKKEEEARIAKEKQMQEVQQIANVMDGWTPEQIATFMSILSSKAQKSAQIVVNANANGASSSSSSTKELSAREKDQKKLDEVLKEREAKRVAAEEARKKEEKARIEKEKAEAKGDKKVVRFAEDLTDGSTGSSSTTTTTTNPNPKPVEKKKDEFTDEQINKIFKWWHGDGEENKGLRGLIAARVDALSKGEDEPEYFNLEAVKSLEKSVWMEWYVKFNIVTAPYDLFSTDCEMMEQIQDKCGKACRCACEGFSPERDDVTTAEYNTLEKEICEATGKKYVEATDDFHGEEEDEHEEEEENEGEENEEEENEEEENNEEDEDEENPIDLTTSFTIANMIEELEPDDDTLKQYLQTPEGKALCVFGYRQQREEKNTDNIFKKGKSLKNKKIAFDDIADLELTEDFIKTYVIEFARQFHEYDSDKKYKLGSLVMLTENEWVKLDLSQRKALNNVKNTLWRVTNHNSDGSYEIIAECNTKETVDALEVDLKAPIVLSDGGKQARKQARNKSSSSTGGAKQTPTKRSRQSSRKRKAFEAPNETRESVRDNKGSRLKKPKTPTHTGFNP